MVLNHLQDTCIHSCPHHVLCTINEWKTVRELDILLFHSQWGSSAIKRRLDRGIASISWHLAFPKALVSHLGAINSDHTPILLDTNPDDSFAHRPFRFEAAWVRDNGCISVVERLGMKKQQDPHQLNCVKGKPRQEQLFGNGIRKFSGTVRIKSGD